MTFRPSVLPDRDNDILSTFTRSFERGRTLQRQATLDRRAKIEFDQRQEDRLEDRQIRREDRAFAAASSAATTPGLDIVDTEDEDMLRLQQALQGQIPRIPQPASQIQIPGQAATDIEGGGMIPAIPGRSLTIPGREPQEMILPRDVLDPSTPVIAEDARILGRSPAGGTAVFSRQLAQDTEEADIRRAAEIQGDVDRELAAPDREAQQESLRMLARMGILTDAAGDRVDPEMLRGDFDPSFFEAIPGRQITTRAQLAARRIPGVGSDPSPVRTEQEFTGDLESAVEDAVDAAQSELDAAAGGQAFEFRRQFRTAEAREDELDRLRAAVDEVEIRRRVLEDMRLTRPAAEQPFIEDRLRRLGGGGATEPPPADPNPALPTGALLSPDDLEFFTLNVSDIADDEAAKVSLMRDSGLSEDEADEVIANRGSGG